jgi:hypothetical protein
MEVVEEFFHAYNQFEKRNNKNESISLTNHMDYKMKHLIEWLKENINKNTDEDQNRLIMEVFETLEIYLKVTENVREYFIPNCGNYQIDNASRTKLKSIYETLKTVLKQ